MQASVNDYYARYVDTEYTAENGVVYTFAKDGELEAGYYTVTFIDKNRTDKDYSASANTLMIADSVNGIPVTAIARDAFNYNKTGLSLKKVIVPEKELSEDMYAELDRNYHRLEIGKRAEVVYYKEYEYVKMSGIVSRIDENARILQIVNTKIPLDDIIEITV